MKKALIKVMAVTTVATVAFSGAALATTFNCDPWTLACNGTNGNDFINGSRNYDSE